MTYIALAIFCDDFRLDIFSQTMRQQACDLPHRGRRAGADIYRRVIGAIALERAQMTADEDETKTDENANPSAITEPRLEDKTLPPAPKSDAPAEPRPNPETPKETKPAAPVATPAQTRPREAEPAKKKGKKGDDGPPG